MCDQKQILAYVVVDRDGCSSNYLEWFNNCAIGWTAHVEKALKFNRLAEANAVTLCLGYLASGKLTVQILKGVR